MNLNNFIAPVKLDSVLQDTANSVTAGTPAL